MSVGSWVGSFVHICIHTHTLYITHVFVFVIDAVHTHARYVHICLRHTCTDAWGFASCIYTYMYTRTHLYTYMHTYVYTYICVHVCVHV